jgi:hypothetical protein
MSEQQSGSMPRSFASPAFLVEVERGTFHLFRSIEVEAKDPKTGKTFREKIRDVRVSPFPLRLFDPKTDREDQIVLNSFDPRTGHPMALVQVGDGS